MKIPACYIVIVLGIILGSQPVAVVPPPRVEAAATDQALTGKATWYNAGPGLYAAAGPALRMGKWRDREVTACAEERCVTVRLSDWCACGPRGGQPTLLDLSLDAFAALASPRRGVIEVEVKGRAPRLAVVPIAKVTNRYLTN